MNYTVVYKLGEIEANDNFEADNVGVAFAMCLQKHPRCQLIKAGTIARFKPNASGFGLIEYDPPPVQRLPVKIGKARKPKKTDSWLIPPE